MLDADGLFGCESGPPVHRNGRVLVVDDQPTLCSMLELILEEAGYQSVSTCSIVEAISLLLEDAFDLVLTDTFASTQDVLGPTLPLREAAQDVPLLLCTAYPVALDTAMAAGFANVVEKPFEIDTLVEAVRALLG